MNLEGFFEKFDVFADVPGAVAKVRELVLELAVRGKLVEQDLSERLTALTGQQKSKSTVRLAATTATLTEPNGEGNPVPFRIPQTWIWTKLGDIGEWGSGSTPARDDHELYEGNITWLKSGELNDDSSLHGSGETISELALQKGTFRRNRVGDVLVAMYGATLGKVAILSEDAVTNQAVCGCTPFNGISNRYLFHYLISQRRAFQSRSEGGAQPNISKQKIMIFPFPLPPLAEQKRIVAKVDELMALCDRWEAQLKDKADRNAALAKAALARFTADPTPENLEYLFHEAFAVDTADLRKTILTLAVRGKLVEQDLGESLEEIWQERSIAFTNTLPKQFPRTWANVQLDSVFTVAGGIQKTPSRAPRENAFSYLGVSNVQRGFLDLSSVKRFELEPGELERRRLEPGDLLVIEGNGSFEEIGRSAKWNGEMANCVHQNHIIRCRPDKIELSDYVLLFLNSPLGTEIMQNLAITSSGLYSLSVGKIRQITLPLPPLAEQKRIVAKVDELMALVDQLEALQTEARNRGVQLLEAAVEAVLNAPA